MDKDSAILDSAVNTLDNPYNLTPRQASFVENYAITLNATSAARQAGYGDTDGAIRVTASRLLTDPNVKAYLNSILARAHMGRDEILARLERQARGNVGLFLDDNGAPDLSTDSAKDNLDLIQQIDVDVSHGTRGTGTGAQDWESIKTRLRLYSAKDALELLGRAQRMFADTEVNVDISIDDNTQSQSIAALMASALIAKDVTPGIAQGDSAPLVEDSKEDSAPDSTNEDSTL